MYFSYPSVKSVSDAAYCVTVVTGTVYDRDKMKLCYNYLCDKVLDKTAPVVTGLFSVLE